MTTGHKSFTLAAENEQDFKDWLSKISSVLALLSFRMEMGTVK